MTAHETALKILVLRVLRERLNEAKAAAAEEIVGAWKPGDRNTGSLAGGPEIGTVTLAKGKATSKVTDDRAFLEWVLENHPEEIEQVQITRVDPGFQERLLNFARQTGDCVNPATGQPVPGIAVEQGEPYATTKLVDDADKLVARAWQDGSLSELIGSLVQPAIEAGDS
jgi:hypothetical protein